MSIAVATVTANVRQITRRDNTIKYTDASLNARMLEACKEISKKLLCLETSATGNLAADATSLTAPSDMVDSQSAILELYLDSKLLDPISFAEWRSGKIDGYAYHNGTIYIIPTSNNARAYTLYYAQEHAALSTNLEFDDKLKNAVEWLTCAKVYDDHEQFDKASVALSKYQREIRMNAPVRPTFTRIRKTRE